MKRLAIFVSGNGTNMERISSSFANHPQIKVALMLCNKAGAGAFGRAERLGIPGMLITKDQLGDGEHLVALLRERQIDWLILAGFLKLIPPSLLRAFPNRIINIHPALLPDYGGKGMYGEKVHQAVIANGEKFSGITIHYVNEQYDEGDIIFQHKLELQPGESPQSLAGRIHQLEYKYYPEVIERLVLADDF
ncbi:MAG: phosphoribosylglycinamide formyltransferase [Bacteroidetes bacterium]|jgi:phosphoribosylglycinamide formyltransferase-1|nr:phosphoribosylglycinamide formyltransferase [Bacteroidota bacterium]MDA3942236.1 phosphoribosylglycinamide formyltransferase [Bacteroidota bacterium]